MTFISREPDSLTTTMGGPDPDRLTTDFDGISALEQSSKSRGGLCLAGAMDHGLRHLRRGRERHEDLQIIRRTLISTRGFRRL